MPIYDWKCADGHTQTHLVSYARRDEPRACNTCGADTVRQFPRTHCPPDGVYSYAPNTGDPERFERQREAIRTGTKVIPRVAKMDREHRDGQLTPRRA